VVENQPGAGGVTAARSVTNAPPDGYTIGWFGNNTAISVSLFSKPFDPRKEAKPIVGVSEFSYLFVTNATSSYKTLQDVISTAKSKPGTLPSEPPALGRAIISRRCCSNRCSILT